MILMHTPKTRSLRMLAGLCAASLICVSATAQDGRPNPARPASQARLDQERAAAGDADLGAPGRQIPDDEVVKGGFKDVAVTDMIEWIANITGKVVIPIQPTTLSTKKITLIIENFVDKNQALNDVFTTFRLNGIGVIETDRLIIIGLLDDMKNLSELPVLEAETDILGRTDRGAMVIKIFRVENRNAEGIFDQIDSTAPTYASVSVDVDSNSIVVYGDVGYCQQVQRLIDELDHRWVTGVTMTYRLAHADAQEIADNILELFETTGASAPRTGRTTRNARQQPGRQQGQPQVVSPSTPGPEIEMRVTVNVQQNTVTVNADRAVIDKVTTLIEEEWDLPRPETTTRVYRLEYTDPIKIRDTLRELLGTGTGTSRPTARLAGQPAGAAGAGGGAGAAPELGNIYRIEAYPDQNSIIVIGKTEASFGFLDDMIEKLDQPSDIGLPLVVELNHADAIDLSEELNVLLQEAGAGIGMQVQGGGLSSAGLGETSSDTGTGGSGGTGGAVGREAEGARDLQFPWQRARQEDDRAPESPLIGTVRIMPIVRQNALAVLCPPAMRQPIRELIESFDRPGRQVMIAAIIAEVELTDDFAFGLRISSGSISPTNLDNALSGGLTGNASNEGTFLDGLFDTSTLELNFDVNVLLQALSQKTNVRILQEPAVFTADNQEAYFFDGQDVPFISESQSTDTGSLNQSFDYKAVGVSLNVRPRITAQNDVDMEIYLELSSIVPGQTLFGGFIVDRRSTTTQIVVRNGQTIVLSGILRDTESTVTRGVPFLEDIPLVGDLFKSRENQKVTSELVAFITPIVVQNPSAQDAMSRENRKLLEELAVPLKEQRDRSERVRERMINPPLVPELLGEPDAAPGDDIRDDSPGRNGDGNGNGAARPRSGN